MKKPTQCGYVLVNGRSIRCSLYLPEGKQAQEIVLICDPLCEERRCSLQTSVGLANDFCADGIAAMRFDYSGTGDSSGEHSTAYANDWIDEIRAMAQECLTVAPKLRIVALRAAALLAAHAAVPAAQLLLIAPIKTGTEYLHQLELRNKLKAEVGGMHQDNAHDFGGFVLNNECYDQLGKLNLSEDISRLPQETKLDIIMFGAGKTLPPAWKNIAERVNNVSFIKDVPFWGQTDYLPPAHLAI